MSTTPFSFFLFVFLLFLPISLSLTQEGRLLLQFKATLADSSTTPLSNWNPLDRSPCNWTGVSCSADGNVTSLDFFNLSLNSTTDPSTTLCRLRHLTRLSLAYNYFNSSFSPSSSSSSSSLCASLAHLDLSMNYFYGDLPYLPSLQTLDLSSNYFSGKVPPSFGFYPNLQNFSASANLLTGVIPSFLGNISTLRRLELADNPFTEGTIPQELGNLSSLESLFLRSCHLVGSIPSSLGRLGRLKNLDLTSNKLTGSIPDSIVMLSSADQILLYDNLLSGELPSGMRNLSALRNLGFNSNKLVGTIPGELFELPMLENLDLSNNSLVGGLPASVSGAKKLSELRLFQNGLSGSIPSDLGLASPLKVAELSQNHFTGEIPRGICKFGELVQLVMIENELSGTLPEDLGGCSSLQRLRLSTNHLSGNVPEGLWGLPGIYMIDLAGNSFSGPVSGNMSDSSNISTLWLSGNRFDGSLPPEIGSLKKLKKLSANSNLFSGPLPASIGKLEALESLDLSNNSISGELPGDIKNWVRLADLNLAMNVLTGQIPPDLGDLPVLTSLDLSSNHLTGEVPSSLQNLKLNLFNLSNNELSGTLPPMFAAASFRDSFLGNPGLCGEIPGLCPAPRKQTPVWVLRSIFILAGLILILGLTWVYWRYREFKKARRMSQWTLTSFHKLGFTEEEIVEGLSEESVIGCGASGKVYKVVLSSGEVLAVKKLWGSRKKVGEEEEVVYDEECGRGGDYGFEKEVSVLGSIRHKNIVKLWCSCTHKDCRLLVYEYMPNGSLGDMLHGSGKNKTVLSWETRYQIAIDTAEGLAYLHHDCSPPIIHRDVKPNNILLDAHFQARLSDFGVAKAILDTKSVTNIAGTHGYLAPEYAYTLRVNERSDTYSFGVVLLELVTGKPAIDPEFRETDLVKWVVTTLDQKGVEHILDQNLDLSLSKEICQVLQIGVQCTDPIPLNRPSMRKVVNMLKEVKAAALKPKKQEQQGSQRLSPYYFDDVSEKCV